jgi:hypothetical protein
MYIEWDFDSQSSRETEFVSISVEILTYEGFLLIKILKINSTKRG